jgi:hypothetical protein
MEVGPFIPAIRIVAGSLLPASPVHPGIRDKDRAMINITLSNFFIVYSFRVTGIRLA